MAIEIEITVRLPRDSMKPLFAPDAHDVSLAFGQVFAKRGYIVIATRPGAKYELGHRLHNLWGYETRRTFVINEFTTRSDYEQQMKFLAATNKTWRRRPMKILRGTTFYRVIPAELQVIRGTEKRLRAANRRGR